MRNIKNETPKKPGKPAGKVAPAPWNKAKPPAKPPKGKYL